MGAAILGNAVLRACPRLLIFVGGTAEYGTEWGQSFKGAKAMGLMERGPVSLSNLSKLVMSPHRQLLYLLLTAYYPQLITCYLLLPTSYLLLTGDVSTQAVTLPTARCTAHSTARLLYPLLAALLTSSHRLHPQWTTPLKSARHRDTTYYLLVTMTRPTAHYSP